MSIAKVASIVCDGPGDHGFGCGMSAQDLGTVSELRRSISHDGWRTLPGGRDLCPACAAKPPTTPEPPKDDPR